MPTLKESIKRYEERVSSLKESARCYRDNEKWSRSIGTQDKMLLDTFGPEKTVELSHKIMESNRSTKEVRNALYDLQDQGQLRESNALSTFGALLRLGVQEVIADAWKLVPVIWDKIVMTLPSDALIQPYANMFRPELPDIVPVGTEFPDSNLSPMSTLVQNEKIGRRLRIESELEEDDQTSQIKMKSAQMGEGFGIWHEIVFAAYMENAAKTYANLSVTPETYTDPDGTTGVYTNSGNRKNQVGTMGSPSGALVNETLQILKTIKDPNGMPVLVTPDTFLYAPDNWMVAQQIFGSSALLASAADATAIGSAKTLYEKNPFQGLLNPVECRFLTSTAWFVGQKNSMSLCWQERTGLQVLQESVDSGDSFKYDVRQWRVRKRGKYFWMAGGSRFWCQGND